MIAGGFDPLTGESKIDPRAENDYECDGDEVNRSPTFPTAPCNNGEEFVIGFRMPNCWNGELRGNDDSHVTYSTAEGCNEQDCPCPAGFSKIPQLWIFIEFPDGYKGGRHVYADGSDKLHIDYFNGWDEQKLTSVLRNCDSRDETGDGIFGPIAGVRCNELTYKVDINGEGQDLRYEPSTKFPTELISTEAVSGFMELPLSCAMRGDCVTDGCACDARDQPLAGFAPNPAQCVNVQTPQPTPVPPIPEPTRLPTRPPSKYVLARFLYFLSKRFAHKIIILLSLPSIFDSFS